jgi:hypothetical protein
VSTTANAQVRPNGSGAAAVLAAGAGSFAVALLALIAANVPAFKSLMIFYRPTGPLSGVTTSAIAVWLALWWLLERRWRRRNISPRVFAAAIALLVASLMLTFPPIADLF